MFYRACWCCGSNGHGEWARKFELREDSAWLYKSHLRRCTVGNRHSGPTRQLNPSASESVLAVLKPLPIRFSARSTWSLHVRSECGEGSITHSQEVAVGSARVCPTLLHYTTKMSQFDGAPVRCTSKSSAHRAAATRNLPGVKEKAR